MKSLTVRLLQEARIIIVLSLHTACDLYSYPACSSLQTKWVLRYACYCTIGVNIMLDSCKLYPDNHDIKIEL